ncbi:acetylcholine-gated cation-selective channel [Mactra antiquata]
MELRIIVILKYVSYFMIIKTSHATSYNDIVTLRQNLTRGYDPNIVPILNQSEVMNVNFVIYITALPEVNPIGSLVKFTASVNTTWIDEKLTWDPNQHGDIHQVLLTSDSIWLPSIALGSGESYQYVNMPKKVLVHHTGRISTLTKQSFTNLCDFKMAHWPFDKHQCKFHFAEIDTEPGKIDLTTNEGNIESKDFQQLGPWVYEECITHVSNNKQAIFYTLKFSRQASFYILAIILPLICIAFLSVLVFMLPCDTGERITFSVTIILAITVFITIMKDEMPKTAQPLPILAYFVSTLILAVFMTTIANACCLVIYHRPETIPINPMFMFLTKMALCQKVQGRVGLTDSNEYGTNDTEASKNDENQAMKTLSDQKKISEGHIHGNNQTQITPEGVNLEQNQCEKVTWQRVTDAMDRIMFALLMTVLVLSTFVSFICIHVGAGYDD